MQIGNSNKNVCNISFYKVLTSAVWKLLAIYLQPLNFGPEQKSIHVLVLSQQVNDF